MAGTLTISTLSDGTNSTSSTNCIKGSAKAWVYFNGSTAVASAGYNVSSITRISAGQYNIGFATAMPTATYSVVGLIPYASWGASVDADIYGGATNTTTATINIVVPFAAFYDGSAISVAVFA